MFFPALQKNSFMHQDKQVFLQDILPFQVSKTFYTFVSRQHQKYRMLFFPLPFSSHFHHTFIIFTISLYTTR